jgi:hypothetical protein
MKRKSNFTSFIICLCIISLNACNYVFNEQLNQEILLNQNYSFEPDTVLSSIETGESSIFILQSSELDPRVMNDHLAVEWNQKDFEVIAEAVYKKAWGELGDGFYLRVIGFSLDCTEVSKGIQWAHFGYAKYIQKEGKTIRIDREIIIKPQSLLVNVLEIKSTPSGFGRNFIDIENLKTTADEALTISENYGGNRVRIDLGDNCQISGTLSPNALFPGWRVDYSNSSDPYIISFEIDPQTGKAKVLK